MIYDTAIIGTGPAGISAALNLKILNKNFIFLGSKELSSKTSKAEKIMNYPGFYAVTGEELNNAFKDQLDKMNIEITEQMVNSIMNLGDHYALLAGSEFYEAKTVLLTTGVAMKATMKNEQEMIGKGVSYCATCDGGLYRGRTIAVICNHKRFEHEVEYLAGIASKVYYFPKYKDVSVQGENIEIINDAPVEVLGDMKVSGISLKSGNSKDVDGIFCLRDSISLTALLPGLEIENNHIKVDRNGKTNMEGVYAAGDCTGRPYQYTKAAGEGNVAAHSIVEYLAKK